VVTGGAVLVVEVSVVPVEGACVKIPLGVVVAVSAAEEVAEVSVVVLWGVPSLQAASNNMPAISRTKIAYFFIGIIRLSQGKLLRASQFLSLYSMVVFTFGIVYPN
jgi:hypothetical protein